ncbi:uncharacterized protein FA14DRAFT_172245 [Meira miltonrushii]|uniref:Uncharacterized protein n=1 Tax=Meira miltonrushii TaxID=1280837 RepID=A0A316VDI5_9BASI|nr:uncharacterized protein FA14DRAFT_172245 [Meira miltonrushii]PWN35632.1 hypothetical protein FA14DRAFT_172245 [Meira miltonrushii]
MVSIINTRSRPLPRSLTHPAGITFLDPAHRVSREELDRRDARWRAMRERAYARAWSEEATLVGSVRRYAAASAILREWEDRTIGRRGSFARIGTQNTIEEGSTVHSRRAPSMPDSHPTPPPRRNHHHFSLLAGVRSSRRQKKVKDAIRRFVANVRA